MPERSRPPAARLRVVIRMKQYLETGRIVSTHGLRGEVCVEPWCNSPEFLLQFDRLYFDHGAVCRLVESARVHKNTVIICFEGFEDVGQAMGLVRNIVYIDREQVQLPEGSYFDQDLIGLRVTDADTGRVYGTLTSVGRTGANDVYGVTADSAAPDGPAAPEILIPAIRDVIRSVDLAQGVMRIAPLKGLFDDAD